MNSQQIETALDLSTQQPLNTRFLNVIVHLNPCLDRDETLLLSYYKQVRATWSTSAIKNLQKTHDIKLTSKLNRCRFAIYAAQLQLQWLSSSSHENQEDIEAETIPSSSSTEGEHPILVKRKIRKILNSRVILAN
ncbi:hypothetical protein H1P_6160001 [Hyella patelloides LEGE 07179]|uniref:Uncharacterized protein n=1 Tax=Hyella patelloides LEGE 07179 TaxID=945734 RepID=A0A563W1H9_9CYAN|nr:hypothetical protein [Hyella patelloides]VEP17487.1 hypothetical protein H1P_6160001 [Hyella patelloides LEGE 07179]